MGVCPSCCNRPKKDGVGGDRAAALRAGGRIRAVRNEGEDPRAPLLAKRRDEPKQEEFNGFDSFVADLSPDADDDEEEEEEDDEAPASAARKY
jgi:hypothetical protein